MNEIRRMIRETETVRKWHRDNGRPLEAFTAAIRADALKEALAAIESDPAA